MHMAVRGLIISLGLSLKMNNTFETQESHIENGAWRLGAAGRKQVKAGGYQDHFSMRLAQIANTWFSFW
jgi:hypothetical protein